MKLTRVFLATAAGLALSSTAAAGTFYLDLGQNFDGQEIDGDGNRTANIGALGANNNLLTSFYGWDNDTNTFTGSVMDTNIQSEMDARGFSSIVGDSNPSPDVQAPNTFRYPAIPGDVNVTGLEFDPSDTIDGENGFHPNNWAGSNENVWGLSLDYFIEGQFDGGNVSYDSGYFNLFFEQGGTGDRIQVMTMNLTGSTLVEGDFNLFGEIDFSFLDEGDPNASFVQNLFVDVARGQTFYDLWDEGSSPVLPISWLLDTNVGGGLPSPEDLALIDDGEGNFSQVRQTTGNATIRYQVPEPGMIFLMGLGLLFIGVLATRRRQDRGEA